MKTTKQKPLAVKKKTAKAIIAELVAALKAIREAGERSRTIGMNGELMGKIERQAKITEKYARKFLAKKPAKRHAAKERFVVGGWLAYDGFKTRITR